MACSALGPPPLTWPKLGGTWPCLPLAIAVSYAKTSLSLRTGVVPSSNVHQLDASTFEWKDSLPNHPSATISFARDGLVLQAQFPMVPFPAGRRSTSILSSKPTGYTLGPVSGTYQCTGILIPSAPGCMTLMTFPFHLR